MYFKFQDDASLIEWFADFGLDVKVPPKQTQNYVLRLAGKSLVWDTRIPNAPQGTLLAVSEGTLLEIRVPIPTSVIRIYGGVASPEDALRVFGTTVWFDRKHFKSWLRQLPPTPEVINQLVDWQRVASPLYLPAPIQKLIDSEVDLAAVHEVVYEEIITTLGEYTSSRGVLPTLRPLVVAPFSPIYSTHYEDGWIPRPLPQTKKLYPSTRPFDELYDSYVDYLYQAR